MNVELYLDEYLHVKTQHEKALTLRSGTGFISDLVKRFAVMHKLKIFEEVNFATEHLNGNICYGRIDFELREKLNRYPIEIDSKNKLWSLKKIVTTSFLDNSIPIWIRWNSPLDCDDRPIGYHLIDLTEYKVNSDAGNGFSYDSLFRFGKYKGKSVVEVFEMHPEYVEWCLMNIKIFKLNDEAIHHLNSLDNYRLSDMAIEVNNNKVNF